MSTSKRILDLYLLSDKLKGEKVLAFYVALYNFKITPIDRL